MSKRVFTILLIACGISAVVYRLVRTRIITAPAGRAEIVVAARTLEIGTLVRDVDLKPAQWSGPLPRDMALKKEHVVGREVVAAIYEGEPLLDSRLSPFVPLQ